MTTNSNETSKADPTHLGHIISSDYYMITLKILRPDQYFGIYILLLLRLTISCDIILNTWNNYKYSSFALISCNQWQKIW